MKAGRELDALVAEKVFGEVEARAPVGDGMTRTETVVAATMEAANDDLRAGYPKMLAAGKLWPAEFCGPEYSTDIAAAWLVLEKMAVPGHSVTIHAGGGGTFAIEWWLHSTDGDRCLAEISDEDSAPLAICRAALETVNVA